MFSSASTVEAVKISDSTLEAVKVITVAFEIK